MNRKHLIRGLAVTASLITLIGVSAPTPALAKNASAKKCAKKPSHPGCATTTTVAPATTTTVAGPTTTVTTVAPGPRIVAHPGTVTETSVDGLVGFAITGSDWTGSVRLNSPGLDIACPGSAAAPFSFFFANSTGSGPSGFTVATDFSGRFNVVGEGANCAAGTYQIEAQEVASPFRVRTTSLTINPPGTLPTGLIVSPAQQKEVGTSGGIAVALIVNGLSASQPFSIASPGINTACSVASVATFNSALFFTALPASGPGFSTDFAGNAALVLVADGCNPGTYPITLTEIGGLARTFPSNFTVLAP